MSLGTRLGPMYVCVLGWGKGRQLFARGAAFYMNVAFMTWQPGAELKIESWNAGRERWLWLQEHHLALDTR